MGLNELITGFLTGFGLEAEGMVDDVYLAFVLLVLFTLAFGHVLEKSLGKRHLLSHFIGFVLALFPVILLFFLFHMFEMFLGIKSAFFYQFTYMVFVLFGLNRWLHHMHEKKIRKNRIKKK